MPKRLIDLFAGCGGMSLGFQNAGFEVLAAYDNWQPAIDIYSRNFNHPIYKKDLSKEDISDELERMAPDIIIGGPPCQDFSIAGKRNFEGKRANLTLIYGNIIQTVRPRWFVMENVYNIEKSPVFDQVLQIFRNAGYGITKHVWDASYMGVPQMRRRYFVIGRQDTCDDFLLQALEKNLSKERMTLANYLGNNQLDTEFYYMHPRSYARRAIFSVNEPSATIRGVNRPMPNNYTCHPADKTKDLARVRSLTSKERSFIQTFPEAFMFVGAKTDIEQAIGNAVPVKMAEYIGRAILNYMQQYD
jgi:DNA (cytosine-5)-methyltransferase 1